MNTPGAVGTRAFRRAWLWASLALACTALSAGCSSSISSSHRFGSSTSSANDSLDAADQTSPDDGGERERGRSEKRPESEIELGPTSVQPDTGTQTVAFAKRGHWHSVTQQWQHHRYDFTGELRVSLWNRGRPVALDRSPFQLQFVRPVALPRRQKKTIQLQVFVPMSMGSGSAELRGELTRAGSVPAFSPPSVPLRQLAPQQYYLLVLSRRPGSFAYLNQLPSIVPPRYGSDFGGFQYAPDYVVQFPIIDQRLELPSNPLTWTTVAAIVWDDVEAETWTPAQQQALVDWLHWGGQLIVNGPASLDLLSDGFLGEFVVPRTGLIAELAAVEVDRLNQYWPQRSLVGSPVRPLPAEVPPITRIGLESVGDFTEVPKTLGLLWEHRVGRGRIAITCFDLTEPRVVSNWGRFDEFFHACVFRRPPREFVVSTLDSTRQHLTWPGDPPEAARVTNLRYFSRDADVTGKRGALDELGQFEMNGYKATPTSGLAGWNDFSAASSAARASLSQAAGVSVPDGSFVLGVISIYLFCLVPLNWAVFRTVGRLEWAWVAAPLIAVVAAVLVVRFAQLDIGFVRSRTEIALIELQTEHPRAHVTRYMSLYTSLSTSYDIAFEDSTALVQPFSLNPASERLRLQRRRVVEYRRDRRARLLALPVLSNTTAMLHSEQMLQLPGSIAVQRDSERDIHVSNNTALPLKSAAVIGRSTRGQLLVAYIGELSVGQRYSFRLRESAEGREIAERWDRQPAMARQTVQGEPPIRELMELACSPSRCNRGDLKLAAWSDQEIPGVSVEPAASQRTTRSIVLVHLVYGPLGAPRRDVRPLTDMAVRPSDESSFEFGEIRE